VRDARAGDWVLQFGGHQGKLEPAIAGKLRQVTALDGRGRPLAVRREVEGTGARIRVAGRPAMIALHYDNGIHTRTATPGPSVERPMNQVAGAVSAVNAQKYHKTIVRWAPIVTRPIGSRSRSRRSAPRSPSPVSRCVCRCGSTGGRRPG
jgi:nickel transport protein